MADGFVMSCDLLESIKRRFDKEGVSFAYPHRVVMHKNSSLNTKVWEKQKTEKDQ